MQYQFVLFLINVQQSLGTMNKTLGLGFINIGDDVT